MIRSSFITIRPWLRREWRVLRAAMFFSLMSSFDSARVRTTDSCSALDDSVEICCNDGQSA